MTRSDAIDMLRQICSYLTAGNPVWRTEPIREACEMAIEALTERGASAEPRWIPVSERLPDDLAEVNVTWVNHKPESYYESIKDEPFTATAVFYKGKWYWWTTYTQDLLAEYGERCNVGLMDEAIEVTAWMPLPEPWEGENDG